MSDDWTEKYRPKSLSEVVGNPTATKEMREWAVSWDQGIPKKRALVLIGDPGVGKTSSAVALGNDMKWGIVEMNASDQRTGEDIRNTALRGAFSNTFTDDGDYLSSSGGGRKLIILDEADNLFGNADRGALPVINELIKTTRQPVVLIVNDFYALSKKSSAIKTDTIQITFRKPTERSIIAALGKIATNEGITVDPLAFEKIAVNAGGDMRAAVRDLESVARGKTKITVADTEYLSERVIRKDMYDLMSGIFRKNDPSGSRQIMSLTDSDPETVSLWVDENLPYEYREPGDLVRGYEKLSRADIFLGRVHRRQHYRFWAYAGDMMTIGVATARFSPMISHDRIRFPQYLMKMSRSKAIRGIRSSICMKIAVFIHTSTMRVEYDVLPAVKEIAINDQGFRVMLVKEIGLEPEELAFILGTKMDSDVVKNTFLEAFPPKEKETKKKAEPVKEPEVVKEPPKKGIQKSIFDL